MRKIRFPFASKSLRLVGFASAMAFLSFSNMKLNLKFLQASAKGEDFF